MNGNWLRFIQRLGVNAARLFVTTSSDLRTFIGSTLWGKNLDGVTVSTQTDFLNAVNKLRTPEGRNQAYPWKNPVKWKTIFDQISSVSRAIYGSDENTINNLNSIGISTLVVEHISCSTSTKLDLLSFNRSAESYWGERWELYKHSYALAVWARSKGVKMIEFYNEPDLELGGCLNWTKFQDYYYIRSLSIQNSYEDSNKYDTSRFVPIKVVASAFARKTFGGDITRYLGDVVVQNRRVVFANATASKNWTNMHVYSYHSYDKSGLSLADDILYLRASVNNNTNFPNEIPVIITEYNAHTSSNWDTLSTTPDDPSEASRLASQMAFLILANISSHYVFKFSITPSFSASRDVAKNGIHWGDIVSSPFDLSDSTLCAEAMRLLTQVKQSDIFLVTNDDSSSLRRYFSTTSPEGYLHLFAVNDKSDNVNLEIDFSKWNISADTKVIVETVGQGFWGEISSILNAPMIGSLLSLTIPGFSTTRFTIRPNVKNFASYNAVTSCTASAGSLSDTRSCTNSSLFIGTSPTTDHERTSVGLIRFQLSKIYNKELYLLKLNYEQIVGMADSRLVILGLRNSSNRWNETTSSWNSLSSSSSGLNILKPLASGSLIDTINKNFINWASSSNIAIVGHLSASKGAKNQVRLIDVTEYVRDMLKSGQTVLTFVLYRPFRNPAYSTSAGTIPADNLSDGSIVWLSAINSANPPQLLEF